MMPVSVEVHHALMDGLHVGRYFESFQSHLLGCDKLLGVAA
jgi:chloramphenicol O-acetyltransferase type A